MGRLYHKFSLWFPVLPWETTLFILVGMLPACGGCAIAGRLLGPPIFYMLTTEKVEDSGSLLEGELVGPPELCGPVRGELSLAC